MKKIYERRNGLKKIKDYDEKTRRRIILDMSAAQTNQKGFLESLEQKSAEDLWLEFGEVPVDENEELMTDWYSFKEGTSRFEVWTWFEEAFDVSVALDLMHLNEDEV